MRFAKVVRLDLVTGKNVSKGGEKEYNNTRISRFKESSEGLLIMKFFVRRAVILLILFNLLATIGRAQIPPFPTDPYLDSWSFYDPTNWYSDLGFAPAGFTNIVCDTSCWSSDDGVLDCNGLILDATNTAYLNYHIVDDGNTNLLCAAGTIWFWFSPDWDSESQGGTGPGNWGEFIDAGAWTSNAVYGYWGLAVDPAGDNLYFSGQTNGATTNYLNVPISWNAGSWHLIALAYTPTNSILYVDGAVATNGIGVIYPPSPEVLTNSGFFIGSDYSGNAQARGEFVDVESDFQTPELQPMGYRGVYTNMAVSNPTGNIVNFINPEDKVIGYWFDAQEEFKPSINYFYNGTNTTYFDEYIVTDSQESRANVARARTLAVGAQTGVQGVIGSTIDLNTQFGFNGTTTDEHSAQWTRPIQTSYLYYKQVLLEIEPTP
jgi:hypothetical protein